MTNRSRRADWILILGLLIGLACPAPPAPAQEAPSLSGPCYLRLTCTGRTTALCDPAGAVYEDLATLHIPIAADEPTPNIHLLRYGYTQQMVYFDRECNRQRYARTDFSCATNGMWYQDSRDQWVSPSRVCTDGSCQKDGGPCRSGSDCCPGHNCHPQLKTCRSLKKEAPGTPDPSRNP